MPRDTTAKSPISPHLGWATLLLILLLHRHFLPVLFLVNLIVLGQLAAPDPLAFHDELGVHAFRGRDR